jgi:DNA helicase HerA-like ATPase
VLAADRLVQSPRLYATFLLWLMSELFEKLPEVGDLPKPKLVFFFDEAHLLFRDAPKSLVEKIEQVVRLIRSKGVGIYFITQNPMDLPPTVLGQLGNRVQHALRAFSPADQKTVRAAADTFRANPKLNTATVITEMKVGDALVSMLEAGGTPAMVDRIRVCPPRSRIGPITPEERAGLMRSSPVAGKYDQALDRESAYEKLSGRAEEPASEKAKPPAAPTGAGGVLTNILVGDGKRQGVAETLAKSVMRGVGSQVGTKLGRAVFRGVLGSLLK